MPMIEMVLTFSLRSTHNASYHDKHGRSPFLLALFLRGGSFLGVERSALHNSSFWSFWSMSIHFYNAFLFRYTNPSSTSDLQRHQFLLQAFLLGKSARRGSKPWKTWGIWTGSFRTKKHPPYLASYCQKNIHLNLLHQLMWPFLSLISFMSILNFPPLLFWFHHGKSCVSPFTHRPLLRALCAVVVLFSLGVS